MSDWAFRQQITLPRWIQKGWFSGVAVKRRVRLLFKVSDQHFDRATFFVSNNWAAIQATGFKNAELALVDLAQFTSISAFADTFVRDNAQIDILVYNAAVALLHYSSTKDGWEETWVPGVFFPINFRCKCACQDPSEPPLGNAVNHPLASLPLQSGFIRNITKSAGCHC